MALIPMGCLALLLALPVEGKWDFEGGNFESNRYIGCRILAVTDMAVMVANHDKNGKVEIYPFHHRLAQGWYNLLDSDPYCYSRADLKSGDRASMRISTKKGEPEACISFSITERQEGAVPPTRRYKLGDWHPYHERIVAVNNFERDGTPFPYHLGFDARPYEFPAFDPAVPRKLRPKPFPSSRPFTYMEYLLSMR